jgi:hypothetical protein
MQRLDDIAVTEGGNVTFVADRDCYYTLTTVTGRSKPKLPTRGKPSAAFPLPYREDFEGPTAGGEAPFFGDQMGKWETVPAGGGRSGMASEQQLPLAPWPILEPQCNDHSTPISIIGDLFFESVRVAADILIKEDGVGAGLGLRIRYKAGRVAFNGLFLFLGAIPGQNPQGSHANPGGLPIAPNHPLKGWALCADSCCSAVIQEGSLPAGSAALTGHWHTVSLEVTDGFARGTIGAAVVFDHVPISATSPGPPSGKVVAQCVADSTAVTDNNTVIGGFDYKQLELNASAPTSANIRTCVEACCADLKCKAWAVAKGKCWLKTGGSFEHRPGEDACGIMPPTAPAATVPPSGWAGLVATLGKSQVDNFELDGTGSADGSAAVRPCASMPPRQGAPLLTTPCDLPGALVGWTVSSTEPSGVLQLRSVADELCIGIANSNVSLLPCSSQSALVYDVATGRITPATTESSTQQCLTALQRQQHDSGPTQLAMQRCAGAPDDSQQFQWDPSSGALRQKGSQCIAKYPDNTAYRDCCIAVCPAHT